MSFHSKFLKAVLVVTFLAVTLFAKPFVTSAKAYANLITQAWSCSGYIVGANYVGGLLVRRAVVDVNFTLDGVLEHITSDWRGQALTRNLFSRISGGNHSVITSGTVSLYDCDDIFPHDILSSGNDNLWTDGSVYKCDDNRTQHNSDDGWDQEDTDTFNMNYAACVAPTPTPTPTLVPSPTITLTPTATPTPKKVDICHATHSDEVNPYNQISVNDDAVDGNGNGSSDHNRDDHQDGEDIIPPGSWDLDGRNWTTEGQAIYNNGCNVPSPTPTVAPTSTPTPTNSPTPTESPTPTPTVEITPTENPTPTQGVTPKVTPTVPPEVNPQVTPTSGPTPTEGPKQPGKESSLADDSMCVNGDFEAVFDAKENGNPAKDILVKFEFNGSTKETKTNESGRAKVSFTASSGQVKASADGYPTQYKTLEDPKCPVVHLDPAIGGRGGQVLGVSTLASTGSSLFTMLGLSSVATGLIWLKRELSV